MRNAMMVVVVALCALSAGAAKDKKGKTNADVTAATKKAAISTATSRSRGESASGPRRAPGSATSSDAPAALGAETGTTLAGAAPLSA